MDHPTKPMGLKCHFAPSLPVLLKSPWRSSPSVMWQKTPPDTSSGTLWLASTPGLIPVFRGEEEKKEDLSASPEDALLSLASWWQDRLSKSISPSMRLSAFLRSPGPTWPPLWSCMCPHTEGHVGPFFFLLPPASLVAGVCNGGLHTTTPWPFLCPFSSPPLRIRPA